MSIRNDDASDFVGERIGEETRDSLERSLSSIFVAKKATPKVIASMNDAAVRCVAALSKMGRKGVLPGDSVQVVLLRPVSGTCGADAVATRFENSASLMKWPNFKCICLTLSWRRCSPAGEHAKGVDPCPRESSVPRWRAHRNRDTCCRREDCHLFELLAGVSAAQPLPK